MVWILKPTFFLLFWVIISQFLAPWLDWSTKNMVFSWKSKVTLKKKSGFGLKTHPFTKFNTCYNTVSGRKPSGLTSPLRPIWHSGKQCNYKVMWCAGAQNDFFPWAHIVERATVMSELDPFSSITSQLTEELLQLLCGPQHAQYPDHVGFTCNWAVLTLMKGASSLRMHPKSSETGSTYCKCKLKAFWRTCPSLLYKLNHHPSIMIQMVSPQFCRSALPL